MSIASEITRLQNAKASIKTSIENKGVTVGDGTLDTYASKIDAIETGITPTGTINITENGTYDVSDKASANVNVSADVSEYFADTLQNSYAYQVIKKIPAFNVGNAAGGNLFSDLPFLTEIPFIDTSTCSLATYMFANDTSLLNIPALNFSNITKIWGTFKNCSSLITIAQLDMQKVIDTRDMCLGCKNLENLGGFLNLGQAYETTKSANYLYYKLDLSGSPKLTHDSLMNVINNLYDIATKGCNVQQLVLGSTNISKLSADEIAIATNKGFSVS